MLIICSEAYGHCCIFNEILNSSTHLLTYNYKIDVENKKKMVQDDPFTSANALRSLIEMINSKYASQYDQMIGYLCYY